MGIRPAAEPNRHLAWTARADRLWAEGRAEDALVCYRQAIECGADSDERISERFLCAMACGDFASAWREGDRAQQLRRAGDDGTRAPWQRLVWNGDRLDGRRVLVRCWDGLADTIQFARYFPHLAALTAAVACEVDPSLLALFAASLPSVRDWVPLGKEPPAHDVAIQASELAHFFRTVTGTIPAAPYLFAAPAPRDAGDRRKRVGLAWHDGACRLSFDALRPLLSLPGIEFVALQRGAGRYEAAASGITVPDDGDVLQMARLIASLDLVVSVDTVAAHLAGAIGAPVWTLLNSAPDWRWLETREDCPWYGSMRVFRQRSGASVDEVVARVRGALQRWSESAPSDSDESGPRNWRSTIASQAAP